MTEELLQKAVEKTRRFIIDLYVKCETDYVNGIKLYEAIVESKILDTTQNQIDTLNKEAKKIVSQTQNATNMDVDKPDVNKPILSIHENNQLSYSQWKPLSSISKTVFSQSKYGIIDYKVDEVIDLSFEIIKEIKEKI